MPNSSDDASRPGSPSYGGPIGADGRGAEPPRAAHSDDREAEAKGDGRLRPRRRLTTPLRWLGAIAGCLLLVVVLIALAFQWSWLRRPIETMASARLHRAVTLTGPMSGRLWSWTPSLTAEDIAVAQPTWAGPGPMIFIHRLTVSVDLRELLRGRVVLAEVDAERPDVRLIRTKDGRTNWSFDGAGAGAQSAPPPLVRRFTINDGHFAFEDAERRLRFAGLVFTDQRMTTATDGRFTLRGQGELNSAPFKAAIACGPLISAAPTGKPCAFDIDAHADDIHLLAKGEITRPFDLNALRARVRLTGSDLAHVYAFTGLTLPNSPPFDLAGDITRTGARFDVDRFDGRVGVSDLGGRLSVRQLAGRRTLTGDLVSRRLKLADMLALFGGGPKAALRGTVASPAEQSMAERLTSDHRILPDAKLDVTRLRQLDADVSYRADAIDAGALPIRRLSLHVKLDHGLLDIAPLSMTLPQGDVSGSLRIDGRGAAPTDALDLRLARAQLASLFPTKAGVTPLEGRLDARVRLTGAGASVRDVAAHANGSVVVAIPQGRMRQAFAELLGIDAKGVFQYLTKDQTPTPVRCAVAEFQSRNGVMTADRLLLDTGALQAQGVGSINLRTETFDLSVHGRPKRFRLIRVAAPITLTGGFAAPKVGVAVGKAVGAVGVGVALGAVVSPLAAILPFLAPGTAKDADCAAILSEASRYDAPLHGSKAAEAR